MSTYVEIKSYRKEVENKIYKDLDNNMNKLGRSLQRKLVERLSTKDTPPRIQTGNLRSSVRYELEGTNKDKSLIVGTNVKYGAYLEHGTAHHPPYPWLFTTIEQNHDLIKDVLGNKAGFSID